MANGPQISRLNMFYRSAATGSIRGSFPGYHIDAYVMGMFDLDETTHSR